MKRRLRFKRVAMEKLGKITKSEDVLLETEAMIIHTLIFPITICRCKIDSEED